MGLFDFGKKSESFTVDEILDLDDKDINKILKKGGQIPVRSAKELRKMKKDDLRRLEGEKGFGAVKDAAKEILKKNRAQNHSVQAMLEEKAKKKYGIKKVSPVDISTKPGHFAIRNPKTIPIKDTMHPAAYKALLEREAKRQGLI
jgi:hypothetical protein